MPNDFVNMGYVSDDGNTYKIRMLARIAGQAGLGFTAPPAGAMDLPRGYEPRYVTVADPTSGRRTKYPVARPNAPAWVAPLTTPVILKDEDTGANIAGAILGCHGERRTLGMHAAPASPP